MSDLSELAERVEALDGPDREVDCLIGVAIGWFITEPNEGWPDRLDYIDIRGIWKTTANFAELVPQFTRSLDAAVTLVPEGWQYCITESRGCWVRECDQFPTIHGQAAATPALSLTAAALRARSK